MLAFFVQIMFFINHALKRTYQPNHLKVKGSLITRTSSLKTWA